MAKFKRHFRIYLVNNHPTYIVDEEGNKYVFHRVSHSERISGKKTFAIKNNPLANSKRTMYIAKNKQIDDKRRFSKSKLKTKKGIKIDYPFID